MPAFNSQTNDHTTPVLENNTVSHHDEISIAPRSRRCLEWISTHLHFLPVVTFIFLCISLITSYVIAVIYKHVEPDFPYISYTAIKPPERGIFSQLMNMASVMMAMNVYVRFAISRELIGKYVRSGKVESRMNVAAVVCGLLSTFGLSMVANFQTVVMRPGHYIGAGLAFGLGTAYCWLHSVLTCRLKHLQECPYYKRINIIQYIISSLLTVFLLAFAATKTIYKIKKRQGSGTKWDTLRAPYLISTVSEWLTVISIVAFSLTFYADFKAFRLNLPSVQRKNDNRSHSPPDAQPLNEFVSA